MPRKAPADDPYASLPDAAAPDDPYAALEDVGDRHGALPEGVRVMGKNSAGQNIYGTTDTGPHGSAARRFLSSAFDAVKGTVSGLYHGLVEGPQNEREARIESGSVLGPLDLRVDRFLIQPMMAEGRKAAEEFRQAEPWNLHPSPEALRHRQLAGGHALATIIPGLGPAAAGVAEKIGTQAGTGDYAGAAGTLAGNAAMYAAPEALGKVARSELITRSIPKGIVNRMIRPAAADLKFGKDPAAAILDEGIVGNRLEDIGARVHERLGEVGRQLDAEAKKPVNATKIVDASTSLQPLDTAMREAVKAGDRKLFAKLLEAKTELTTRWRPFRDAQGNYSLRAAGPRNLKMSPFDALQFKRQVGDRVRWTEDPLDGEVNAALGKVYGNLKNATDTAVPGLRELNQRYSNLVGALKAVERRIPVEARAANWSLSDIALGASGHLPLAIVRHVGKVPAIRTRGAQALYNLPRVVPQRPAVIAAPVISAAQSEQQGR
jgi:hypothetical protein